MLGANALLLFLIVKGATTFCMYSLFEERISVLLKMLDETHHRIDELEAKLKEQRIESQYEII
jgi:hypothetical protein